MGKTIHIVSNAAGVVLKTSKKRSVCEAFIDARADEVRQRIMEPSFTPTGDPCMLYKDFTTEKIDHGEGRVELSSEYRLAYALTTTRLT